MKRNQEISQSFCVLTSSLPGVKFLASFSQWTKRMFQGKTEWLFMNPSLPDCAA
jgi:hypothetical protein